jgi:hypothetical protein
MNVDNFETAVDNILPRIYINLADAKFVNKISELNALVTETLFNQ